MQPEDIFGSIYILINSVTEQNAYGLQMSRDFYKSLIIQEVAHFIAEKIAGCKIAITLSEYIAYFVQPSQMQPMMRQAILSRHPLKAFSTEDMQLDIMLFDPLIFSLKSYFHFKQSKEILSSAVKDTADFAYWLFH